MTKFVVVKFTGVNSPKRRTGTAYPKKASLIGA